MSAEGTPRVTSCREAQAPASRSCLVLCPRSDEVEVGRRSDELVEFIVAPALEACGYAPPERADGLGEGGPLTASALDLLLHADLVIADLTDHDPSVYYELAVRHTLGLPVVPLILVGQRPPFEVADGGMIEYDHRSLTRTRRTQLELMDRVQQAAADPRQAGDNLVRLAVSVHDFCARSGAGDRLSAVVLERLNDLERKLDRLAQEGPRGRDYAVPTRFAADDPAQRRRAFVRHDVVSHFRPPRVAEPRHVSARA